jgi:hypothetical protein
MSRELIEVRISQKRATVGGRNAENMDAEYKTIAIQNVAN